MKTRRSKLAYAYARFKLQRSPQTNLVWGFFLYLAIGALLLCLPVFHRHGVSPLDNLFTAASAISTTGLVTVSVYDSYNFFGQLVVMILFQLGGIGYMTLTTYYLLLTTKRLTRWHTRVVGAEFALPNTIRLEDFIQSVIVFTLVMETLGAAAFYWDFSASGLHGWQALWFAVFHSVSAFCTAGFSLFDDSFVGYQNDVFLNVTVAVLSIAGSLGFIVATDLWYRLLGKSQGISFTTKIVIYGFSILLVLGTALIYATEPLVSSQPHALMKAFFQAMTALTTVGFNTIDIGALSPPVLLLVIFLMYVGASPSGTGGGMKITTLTAMISVLKSRLAGERRVTFFSNPIPGERIYVATSTFMLYTSLIFVFTMLLAYSERAPLDEILFEVASALGTVGLSAGLTGELSPLGKTLVILLMFVGRVGVLTFGFALLSRKDRGLPTRPGEDLAV